MTDEHILQYRPARYARSEPSEEAEQAGYPAHDYSSVPYPLDIPMPFPHVVAGYPYRLEEDIVRRFLREVGLPEGSIRGSRSDLVSYLRVRLGM